MTAEQEIEDVTLPFRRPLCLGHRRMETATRSVCMNEQNKAHLRAPTDGRGA